MTIAMVARMLLSDMEPFWPKVHELPGAEQQAGHLAGQCELEAESTAYVVCQRAEAMDKLFSRDGDG